jgi:hypothetical protein
MVRVREGNEQAEWLRMPALAFDEIDDPVGDPVGVVQLWRHPLFQTSFRSRARLSGLASGS